MQQSTSLHEIRDFLGRHDSAPPAWSDARAPLDALYGLLRERREDPVFWAELADLTRKLEDARRFEDAPALEGARLDQLLTDLREALPVNGSGPGNATAWIGSGIGLSALAAFVLLGSSLGCPTTAVCPEAADDGIAEDDQVVYCDLVAIIDAAEIDDGARDDLLACLPNMNAEEREDLLDDFENASEEELADLLMALAATAECHGSADDDDTTDPWDDDDH